MIKLKDERTVREVIETLNNMKDKMISVFDKYVKKHGLEKDTERLYNNLTIGELYADEKEDK